MKIGVNTRFLLPNRLEGLGWFTHEVFRRLVRQHPQHEFVFFFDRAYDPDHVFGPNVTPVIVPPPTRLPALWYYWLEIAIPAQLRRRRCDVFVSPDNFCSLRTSVPNVLITHDLAHHHFPKQLQRNHRNFYRRFVPRYHRRAEKIVTVSNYTKQDIITTYGTAPDKITVACNGVREHFRPIAADQKMQIRERYTDGAPYFLYVGALHPRKNVDGLIRAFDHFKTQTGSSTQLVLGGRKAWQTADLQRTYEQSEYRSEIHFTGYLPDAELARVMAAARALVYASHFEGFGVPLLEAMHCDVPIITSNVSSMTEVAGSAALLVQPTDDEDIANALMKLDHNENLRRRLVKAGQEQRKKYDWDRAAAVVWAAIEAAGHRVG